MIATLTLPDGREVVITSRPRCYGASFVLISRDGKLVGAGLVRDRKRLEEILAGPLRGVLASRCMACGGIFQLELGSSELGAISDGYCSERCLPEWGQI